MKSKVSKYTPSPHSKKLPTPILDNWNWMDQGLCKEVGSDYFFYEDMERGPEKERRIEQALAICSDCPVKKTCLKFALDTDQMYGIWGGTTQEQRAKMKKRKIHDI